MQPRLLLTLLSLLTALGCSAKPAAAPVYSSGTGLVDAQGRSVILRGVNIRAAGFFDEYHAQLPLPPFTADDCRILGDELGMNQLRLPISWSFLEPTRGNYNQAFIDQVLSIAAACNRYGVYTLVDLHQDGWSKYLAADGAPFWAHDPPLPAADIDERAGGQSTTGAPVQAAFSGFFGNPTGLMQDYAKMAAHLSQRIAGQPGIIGLEIMNEPLATQDQLTTLYRVVAPAVRAVAPDLPLYFEPDAIRNLLDAANPDPLTVSNTVYSPHLYTGVFQGNWVKGQTSRIENSITGMLMEASQAKGALMITELGNNPADAVGAAWLGDAYALLDKYAVSGSMWVYEEWPSTCGNPSCWGLYDETPMMDANGQTTYARTLRAAAVPLLARAYPVAIAGHIDSFAYDVISRKLTVQMKGTSGTHVLAAPTRVYSAGVTVTCDGKAVPSTRMGGRVQVSCAGQSLVMSPAGS